LFDIFHRVRLRKFTFVHGQPVRERSADAGWVETSLPGAAAAAIRAVKDLSQRDTLKDPVAICHQLRTFEAFEHRLLATCETPEELVRLSAA
jgi:hypothetical protein